MFERFTDRARRSLVLSQEESKSMGHNFIGTEHILLGLAVEGEGVAHVALSALGLDAQAIRGEIEQRVPNQWRQPAVADALATVGIDLERVRREIEATFGEGALRLGTPGFTPKAKAVLEASLSEATLLDHNYIGTEHLLLGLAGAGEGLALEILTSLGTDADAVRRMVLAVMTSAGHLAGEPDLLDLRAIEDAIRVLPNDQRDAAKDILRTELFPVRGAAFVAIAKDESAETVRQQIGYITSARDEALRRLDEIGVGSFVRKARSVQANGVHVAVNKLERAVNVLVAALQSEQFTPQQVSVAAGARRSATDITAGMWQAIWQDREAADEIAIGRLLDANGQLAQLVEQLATFAAQILLGIDDSPADESDESAETA